MEGGIISINNHSESENLLLLFIFLLKFFILKVWSFKHYYFNKTLCLKIPTTIVIRNDAQERQKKEEKKEKVEEFHSRLFQSLRRERKEERKKKRMPNDGY